MHQVVHAVKTPESERLMHINEKVLGVLKAWKQHSEFFRGRRLDVRFTHANRAFAILLRRGVAGIAKSAGESWHRSS